MITIVFGSNAHGDLIGRPVREQWRIFVMRMATLALATVSAVLIGIYVLVPIYATHTARAFAATTRHETTSGPNQSASILSAGAPKACEDI